MTIPDEQLDGRGEMPTSIPPPPPLVVNGIPGPAVQKPVSVIVIAILFFLGALAELVSLFTQSSTDPAWLTELNLTDSALFFVVLINVGIGLLCWRPAARVWAIVAIIARFVIMLPLLALEVANTSDTESDIPQLPMVFFLVGSIIITVLMGIYFAVLIFFLTRPGVKAAFRRQR